MIAMPQHPGEQPKSAPQANAAMRALALHVGRRAWTTAELARYAALNEIWLAATAREHDDEPADAGMILAA
jgi:hypothetical protein